MTSGAPVYPALWLCGRLFACPGHPPLSRAELTASMSPYAELPAPVRRVVALRTAALGSLMRLAAASFSASAAVLDVGCGHGQLVRWLALEPGRSVAGIDSSEARIRVAQGVGTPPNLRFERAAALDYLHAKPGPCDGFVFADTLLYMTADAQRSALTAARESARVGAVMLIKDSITEPRWKLRATQLEERLKLRAGYYGNSPGECLTYRSRAGWVDLLGETGWQVIDECRTPRVLPYPGWVAVCHAV
jgi:SAM-dependent methyltransferase